VSSNLATPTTHKKTAALTGSGRPAAGREVNISLAPRRCVGSMISGTEPTPEIR
jgi:hypothetical protein